MVLSFSEDATRAAEATSRNYPRQNGGNVILNVLISFQSRDVFCTPSRLLVQPFFRMFHVLLSVFIIWLFIGF